MASAVSGRLARSCKRPSMRTASDWQSVLATGAGIVMGTVAADDRGRSLAMGIGAGSMRAVGATERRAKVSGRAI